MKTFTIALFLSVFLTFTTAYNSYDSCEESFALVSESLLDFRDHFLSHRFNQLALDIKNMKKSTKLVQETCGDFVTITPDIFFQDAKECSYAYTLILGLVHDNIFDTLDDASLFQEFPFILEEIVGFLIQIGETDCLNQWRIKFGQEPEPVYESNEEAVIEFIDFDPENGEESLGLFIPLYFEREDQEESLSAFIADGEFTIETETEAIEGEDDSLVVHVDLYFEQEDQEDTFSVFVAEDEFIVENVDTEENIDEDDSLSVFVPLYFEKEDQVDAFVVEDVETEDNIDEDDSLNIFVPLYFEKEDQEATLSVFVSEDEIANGDSSLDMFLPMM